MYLAIMKPFSWFPVVHTAVRHILRTITCILITLLAGNFSKIIPSNFDDSYYSTTYIFTHGLMYVQNAGSNVRLECEFSMFNYSHFHNPVVWRKYQRMEDTQINIMSTILRPFVGTDRFEVSFEEQLDDIPPRYKSSLIITNLSLEDSGNYTCEIRGRGSVIIATVTHYTFIRAAVGSIYLTADSRNSKINASSSSKSQDIVDTAAALSTSVVIGSASAVSQDPCQQDFGSASLVVSPSPAVAAAAVRRGRAIALPFVEGVPGALSCVSIGGYPPPDITVRLGSVDVTDQFVAVSVPTLCGHKGLRLIVYETQRKNDGFVTSSADDGKRLTCNVTVVGMTPLQVEAILEVSYAPVINCRPALATPGERNVHLDCTVKSRPALSALFWVVDVNGTLTVADGEVVGQHYWARSTDVGGGVVESQLFLREALTNNFRLYTLVAENNVAVTTHRVPLLEKFKSQQTSPVWRMTTSRYPLDRGSSSQIAYHNRQQQQQQQQHHQQQQPRHHQKQHRMVASSGYSHTVYRCFGYDVKIVTTLTVAIITLTVACPMVISSR